MLRQYTVTLHRYEDLDAFYDDMETPGGDLYIPDRAVDLVNRRPLSRNTVYWLTEAEAEQVRGDSRVLAVELAPEEQNIRVEPLWSQTGTFYKGSTTTNADLTGSDKNWGLLRGIQGLDQPRHGYDDQRRHTATISTSLAGDNVDIVIVDGHIRPTHAEFQANADGTGGSRVQQIDWLSYAGAIGKTPPSSSINNPVPLVYDYSSYYNSDLGDHGAAVAAVAAGNTQGWARNSKIYNISPYNESGMVSAEDCMDYIRYWHSIKPTNPNTGRANPTVVNLSWGTYRYINVLDITTITHRGVTYSGPWTNTGTTGRTYQELGLGFNGARQYRISVGDTAWYLKISEPIAAWQADTNDLIADGIHVVVAAGNDGLVQDLPSGPDYNNSIATISVPGGIYYNRRSGPASGDAISVASIDSSSYAPGLDYYSNRGPAIDIAAPGSGIVSAINRTSAVAGSVADSRGLNNDRIAVASGTSFAAPQVAGILATILASPGHQSFLPSYSKTFLAGISQVNELTDYQAPYNLAGTPNRYVFYREYYLTTTTTASSTSTTTTTSTSTTTSTTSTTSTSTSTTSTTTLYYPPAQIITLPVVCNPVPASSSTNLVGNVAWYQFTLTANSNVVVETSFTSPQYDTHIALFDNLGEVVVVNDDAANSDLSYFQANLTSGTYWIAVGLYETKFNQRFRAESLVPLPATGVCFTAYNAVNPPTSTTTTTTSTSTTTSTTTSTSTTSTSTTTAAPYPVRPIIPPGYTLERTWCDNFVLWGLYRNQFNETFSGVIEQNSATCGVTPATTSTSTTSTTTTFLPPSAWDSTVTRLSILENYRNFAKYPTTEPGLSWQLARGELPQGVTFSNVGIISGAAVVSEDRVVFGQPIYIYNFGALATDISIPNTGFRQYSISVVTNGLLVPNQFLPTNTVFENLSYQYQITSGYTTNSAEGRVWRLKWGLLPPSATWSESGLLSVTARTNIRPFRRQEFLPDGFVDTGTNNDQTWYAWLRGFLARPHDFDYQFVVELANNNGYIDSSHTIRIIHLKPPLFESWFQQNASTLRIDASQLYFLILTTEHDGTVWSTDGDLGVIANGAVSKKQITSSNQSNISVQYKIEPNSESRIPQGLYLQPDGLIVGRASFRTYIDDPDALPPQDLYEFTVRAYTAGEKSFSTRRFRLQVIRQNQSASDNLYLRAFPPSQERSRLEAIVNDTSIIPADQVYRPTDPWFGRRRELYIEFAMGLNVRSLAEYDQAINLNHYDKRFYFGPVQTAVVLDGNKVEYEIVYITIVDPKLGRSQESKLSSAQTALVDLTGTRTYLHTTTAEQDLWYYSDQIRTSHQVLAENDVYNMKQRILDNIGQRPDAGNLAPEWSTSNQLTNDGFYNAPIGFVPIVVLAYVKPGTAESIRFKLSQIDFKFAEFEFNCYQLEDWLSEFWDSGTESFIPGLITLFDGGNTNFDYDSTRIIDNQEQYRQQHTADKYIKFPRTGVFR